MPDVEILLPFEAYKGNEPYIFVSYAHKDGKLIFPEIKCLHDQGYRIWYDEGIDPGNEWPEEVAQALANSSFFLVYISPYAVNSRNVRNEINFALNNKKQFIAIHIAETKLPPGLELRMGDIQAILKYRISEESYSRKMLNTLPKKLISKIHRLSPGVDHLDNLKSNSEEMKEEHEHDKCKTNNNEKPPPPQSSRERRLLLLIIILVVLAGLSSFFYFAFIKETIPPPTEKLGLITPEPREPGNKKGSENHLPINTAAMDVLLKSAAEFDREGDELMEQRKYDEAIGYYEKSLKIRQELSAGSPNNVERQRELADSYWKLSRALSYVEPTQIKQAIKYISQAIKILKDLKEQGEPDQKLLATYYGELSFYELLEGRASKAMEAAIQGIRLDPKNDSIKLNLAHSYLLTGLFDKAKAIFIDEKNLQIVFPNFRTWRLAVSEDFDALRKAGIDSPDMKKGMKKIEDLLAEESLAHQDKNKAK
jgi:TIR domain